MPYDDCGTHSKANNAWGLTPVDIDQMQSPSLNSKVLFTTEELLDLEDDNDFDDKWAVGEIVEALIKNAQYHKSYVSLFKLQAVKNYLDLLQKYSQNPKIPNPHTRASLAVAKGVGKGPYFA